MEFANQFSRRGSIRGALGLLQPEGAGWNVNQIQCCWILRRGSVGFQEANILLLRRAAELNISESRVSEVLRACDKVYHLKGGLTLDGKPNSQRCLENVGERRFLVTECDFSKYARDGVTKTTFYDLVLAMEAQGRSVQDMCASVINLLMQEPTRPGPLVAVVNSGGKSLQGWWYIQGKSDEDLRPFFSRAIVLGCDPVTWVRCQLVRMPHGRRTQYPYRKQTLIYLDKNYGKQTQ